MDVVLADDAIRIGEHFRITFQRTLRIPNDGRVYPLPPGLGRFPVYRCADFPLDRIPGWRSECGFFIAMYQREALWLGFTNTWPPVAVKVAVGGINAVSGASGEPGLRNPPQNYVVCPEQLWLDGVNAGAAMIRQFVAMPLGSGSTVEAALTGTEVTGGMQIEVYVPKTGASLRAPAEAPRVGPARQPNPRMGLAAGGQMQQKIYPDRHGIEVWNTAACARISLHILNSACFRDVTGVDPPPTPIDARTYTERGLPWFKLYEEQMGDVDAPGALANLPSLDDDGRDVN